MENLLRAARRLREDRLERAAAQLAIDRILEAGAFGFAADFGTVQDQLTAKGLRNCAYDRAGLGFSDAIERVVVDRGEITSRNSRTPFTGALTLRLP